MTPMVSSIKLINQFKINNKKLNFFFQNKTKKQEVLSKQESCDQKKSLAQQDLFFSKLQTFIIFHRAGLVSYAKNCRWMQSFGNAKLVLTDFF